MTLHELRDACLTCQRCALADKRVQVVFGDGNPESPLMFVGEGPGQQEDLQGIPFVGPAGQLLDQMLDIIGLNREKYYIANIVKCRPPGNRDPLNTEQDACIPWLRKQVICIQPRIIVCLGRIAALRLIRPDYKITQEHGQWVRRGNFHMTALYHPSALLRDPSKRPETFDDLKSLQMKIREICPELGI